MGGLIYLQALFKTPGSILRSLRLTYLTQFFLLMECRRDGSTFLPGNLLQEAVCQRLTWMNGFFVV